MDGVGQTPDEPRSTCQIRARVDPLRSFVVLVLGARGVHVVPPPADAPPEELGVVTAKASLWFLMGVASSHGRARLCLCLQAEAGL